jgi:hypothetical protein
MHAKSRRHEGREEAGIGLAEGQGDRSKGGYREDYPVKQMPGNRLIIRNGREAVRITSRLRAFARVTNREKLRDGRTRSREGTKEEKRQGLDCRKAEAIGRKRAIAKTIQSSRCLDID